MKRKFKRILLVFMSVLTLSNSIFIYYIPKVVKASDIAINMPNNIISYIISALGPVGLMTGAAILSGEDVVQNTKNSVLQFYNGINAFNDKYGYQESYEISPELYQNVIDVAQNPNQYGDIVIPQKEGWVDVTFPKDEAGNPYEKYNDYWENFDIDDRISKLRYGGGSGSEDPDPDLDPNAFKNLLKKFGLGAILGTAGIYGLAEYQDWYDITNAAYDTDDLRQAAINAYWVNYAKNHDITVVKRVWKVGEFTQDDIRSKLPVYMANSEKLQIFFDNYFNDTNTFIVTFGEHVNGYNQWFTILTLPNKSIYNVNTDSINGYRTIGNYASYEYILNTDGSYSENLFNGNRVDTRYIQITNGSTVTHTINYIFGDINIYDDYTSCNNAINSGDTTNSKDPISEDNLTAKDDFEKQKMIDDFLKEYGVDTIEEFYKLILKMIQQVNDKVDDTTTDDELKEIVGEVVRENVQDIVDDNEKDPANTTENSTNPTNPTDPTNPTNPTDPTDPSPDDPYDIGSDPNSGGGGSKRSVLTTIFPFCIPFDLIYLMEVLSANPATPVFKAALPLPDPIGTQTITIDFTNLEPLAKVFRTFEIILFILGLILITRNIIKG